MVKIEKQELIKTPLSDDALKLAQSLYSTYILNNKEPSMCVSLKKLYHLFGLSDADSSLEKIFEIFADLSEPVMVHDFVYRGKKYSTVVLTFCKYEKIVKDDMESCMRIEMNEMYLDVLKNYMLHPFLEIKY